MSWELASSPRPDGSTLVSVAGELDVATAAQLDVVLDRLVGEVEIDCGGLTYIDSSGLRVLLHYCHRDGSTVRLSAISDIIYCVFEMTGVLNVFDIPLRTATE